MNSKTLRVIARLDVKGQNLIKGVNLEGLRVIGDPNEFALKYYNENADEILYIDPVASLYGRSKLTDIIKKSCKNIFIPITVGGGIKNLQDVEDLLKSGADKVSVNSAAVREPLLIKKAANTFGSQCIVLAIDAYKDANNKKSGYNVSTHGGKQKTELDALEWAVLGVKLGAGELLLTSMNSDGTKSGYDLTLTSIISNNVSVPVIASGGAGKPLDMVNVVLKGGASAVLAASIFHYGIYSIEKVKKEMQDHGIYIRKTW